MPELRHDPLSGRRVIVAPERDARPHSSRQLGAASAPPADCPFCHGNEHATPPEVHRTGAGAPDTSGWDVRVVPNLYPIVGGHDAAAGATGAHEVVVLCPDHFRTFGMLDDDQAVDVVTVLRDRTRAHLAAGRSHVQVFINHGKEAGASLAHPHAQVVALDVVPPAVLTALVRFAESTSDLVSDQLADVDGGPLALSDGDAPTWCPYASGAPYEIRIAHRAAGAGLESAGDDVVRAVAIALRDSLARLESTVGDVAYNVIFHSASTGGNDTRFHWYVEILPRLSVVAGFEIGTGVFVNIVAPETAASRLARALPIGRPDVHIEVATDIDAPPAAVWAVLEPIESHVEWMADAARITFRGQRRRGVGTEFECLTRVGPLSSTDVMTVTRWEPGAAMGIEHRGVVVGRGQFTLSPLAVQRTRFRWEEELHFPAWMGGRVGELAAKPVLTRIWQGNLRRLRTRVEAA